MRQLAVVDRMATGAEMIGIQRMLVVACASFAVTGCPKPLATARVSEPRSDANAWWKKGVCYEVFVRSFYDSDGDGIGDLEGLIARLDYINDGNPNSTRSLGANCIWLTPIDKATSYHGYDVVDYYHVDPHYGTDEDFRELVRQAHQRGIHVIVDFVPNHASSEHPFFQAALRDPSSKYRSWFRFSRAKPAQLVDVADPDRHLQQVQQAVVMVCRAVFAVEHQAGFSAASSINSAPSSTGSPAA